MEQAQGKPALLAGLFGIKVSSYIVVPKVIQVNLLVDLLKSLYKKRKSIGYASGGRKDYDLSGVFDIIVVTYSHFLRKVVRMFINFGGYACILATLHRSKCTKFSEYLVVLDEVHKPSSEIQTVLLLSDRIENQKIITSATMNKQMISDYKGLSLSSFALVEHEVVGIFPSTITYEPVDASNRIETIKSICSITRRYIDRSEGESRQQYNDGFFFAQF